MNVDKDLVAKAAQLAVDIIDRGLRAKLDVMTDAVTLLLYCRDEPSVYISAKDDVGMAMMLAAMNEVLA